MEPLASLFSWSGAATAAGVSLSSLVFYRLVLHPLARFPGPRLAAITRWYEGYYDVVQNGQYTFKIRELHQKYGEMICYQSPEWNLPILIPG